MAADKMQMWFDHQFLNKVSRNPISWGQVCFIMKASFYKSLSELQFSTRSVLSPKPMLLTSVLLHPHMSTVKPGTLDQLMWNNAPCGFTFFPIWIGPNRSHSAWPSGKPVLLIPLLQLSLPGCWVGPEEVKKLEFGGHHILLAQLFLIATQELFYSFCCAVFNYGYS